MASISHGKRTITIKAKNGITKKYKYMRIFFKINLKDAMRD